MAKLFVFYSICSEHEQFSLEFLGSAMSRDFTSAVRSFIGSKCDRNKYKLWESKEGRLLLDPRLMKDLKKTRGLSMMVGWLVKEIDPNVTDDLRKIETELQYPCPLAFVF